MRRNSAYNSIVRYSGATIDAMKRLVTTFDRTARQPKIMTMEEFAQTLTIPAGPYEGSLYRFHRLPWARLFMREVDSGRWNRFVGIAVVQGGKTFHFDNLPILYYTTQLQENVIFGMPTGDMAADKWQVDLRPLYERSGMANLMPLKGKGSRGGTNLSLISLKNGARIKFMTGNGGDEKRSGYSSRIIVITEADKMDSVREASDETNPIKQIENRAGAYDEADKRVFIECTVSNSKGYIWTEYLNSSKSRIVCPCPHCGEFVAMERENLKGWQDASNQIEAGDLAYWECPKCNGHIDEQQRREMNADGVCRMLHDGQSIDRDGNVTGEPVPTMTFGLRINAFNNLLKRTAEYGRREYMALRAEDVVSAEREMLQFVWALPADPDIEEVKELSAVELRQRTMKGVRRGICPKGTQFVTAGIDIGKWRCWAVYVAWTPSDDDEDERLRGHVIDYQCWKLDQERDTTEAAAKVAITEALQNYVQYYESGFPTEDGKTIPLMFAGIDSGYLTDCIYEFCASRNNYDVFPVKGFGQSVMASPYRKPKTSNRFVRFIGNHYHLQFLPSARSFLFELDADYWKSQVRERLSIDVANPQSVTLFDSPNKGEHTKYVMHLMSEKPVLDNGKIRWEKQPGGGPNHWFDATAYALMMGSYAHRVLIDEQTQDDPEIQPDSIQSEFLYS